MESDFGGKTCTFKGLMSSLSSKYWVDPRRPRVTTKIKCEFENQVDSLNLKKQVINCAKPGSEVPTGNGVYFVLERKHKEILYIGSTKCFPDRLKQHFKAGRFSPDNNLIGVLHTPKTRSMRVVEENLIWRYQPPLNNAIKQDEFREKYSFCWCGELSYSHDLCLRHFEELISCCRWDTPDKEYQKANLPSIQKGLILRLVHSDISLTKERNKSFYEFYPSVAKKYLDYTSKGLFTPGQIQITKLTEKLSVCSVMVLSDRFRFTPWFEHATQEDYDCFSMGLRKAAVIAKQKGLPIYIPYGMGTEYGMCWHNTKNELINVFNGLTMLVYD